MNAAASILLAGAALVAGWTVATPVAAAELRIISTPAASTALKMAATDFERVAGHKVTIEYSNIAIARRRISAGEAFDVVVVSPTAIEDLVRMGTIAVGDTLNLGRTGLALFGHKGAARPDIGTEEALKRTLLSARLVAYSDTCESGIGFVKVLDCRTGRGRGRLRRPARQRGDGS
ncbi:MAG: substrate-binding domain-containing protein [Burkholderiaceae bacterium]|nr:substrate-binding domain-containing protein [Burkholderiaceae bacterium]